jgi:hypothetical protein
MVVAKKKTVQKKPTVTSKVKVSPKRKITTKSATGSITESLQFRLMVVCFTLLSILFTTVAFWRYG